MYSSTAAAKRRVCSSALAIGTSCGQAAVALLLERERRARPRELALHDPDLVLPGVRYELHVLEIPVVVRDANA